MEILYLSFIFVVSLAALVKGADWFLEGAEKIGLALKLSPFIVGVTVVSLGTSFPELFTGVIAVFRDVPEIVMANALGSNIANILLVVGISALVGGKLVVTKSLIDLDLPLLSAGTAILLVVILPFNGEEPTVSVPEALFLISGYVIYFVYVLIHEEEKGRAKTEEEEIVSLPGRSERRDHVTKKEVQDDSLKGKDVLMFLIGGVLLFLGSNYVVDSVVRFSEIFMIGAGVISIIAVAIGTTLPEISVCVKAARENKSEVALGNIFGSNIFNSFIVIGVPGLFGDLFLEESTFLVGVPFLVISTILFVISGISRRIHAYEGAFYILLYALFVVKIFNIF